MYLLSIAFSFFFSSKFAAFLDFDSHSAALARAVIIKMQSGDIQRNHIKKCQDISSVVEKEHNPNYV